MSTREQLRKRRPICDLGPIFVSPEIWYYENPTKIEIYLSREFVDLNQGKGIKFELSKRKLKASLRRMAAQ
jgi:hypothetical protein